MYSVFAALVLALLLDGSLWAVEPIQLAPYPQKVRTFYSLADAAVPALLRAGALPLPAGNVTAVAQPSCCRTGWGAITSSSSVNERA